MSTIESRLSTLGLVLPQPKPPIANYVPFVRSGDWLIVSGQLCLSAQGAIAPEHTGRLGAEVSVEQGREAARLCAINVLAQAQMALGTLDNVVRVVRLGGFISAAPGFTDLPPIMNGASDLMVEIFGDIGRHARTTIGVASLPLNAAVEVEALFEVA